MDTLTIILIVLFAVIIACCLGVCMKPLMNKKETKISMPTTEEFNTEVAQDIVAPAGNSGANEYYS